MSDTATNEVSVTPSTLNSLSQEDFSKWAFGEVPTLDPNAEAEEAEVQPEEQASEVESVPTDAEGAEAEAADAPADDTDEKAAEEDKPAVVLPFKVEGAEGEVDAAMLAEMKVTLKANGKVETLPLADVVRRAQSEPAVQQQYRQERQQRERLESEVESERTDAAQLRTMLLRALRDPEYHAALTANVEEYDAPENRAARAERELAEEREYRERERATQQHQQQAASFFRDTALPILSQIQTQYPTVTEEEILGRFNVDTAEVTVNGVIAPEHYDKVARYLEGPLAAFAKARHEQRAAAEAKAAEETARAQRERQRLKNQTAQASKPAGVSVGANAPAKAAKPSTYREAQTGALNTLLSGL